ncbi:MAG: type IV pilin-like G/H family protein [Nostoc sp.]|uniref:type IV pilin-like G/H family protein n=1 Tax=Nostoc sp. TaxID=1180 RepID=UPI002FF7E582
MKTELKAKFLQHILAKKKGDEGFTLIELLVVIIIIGILSAIALPSFLNQASKAKQSEAKQYTGSMNRSQQAYYLENAAFSSSIDQLGLGIKTQTDNYVYSAAIDTASSGVINNGVSQKVALKNYEGVVSISFSPGNSQSTTLAVLCETPTPSAGTAQTTIILNGTSPSCTANYLPLASK